MHGNSNIKEQHLINKRNYTPTSVIRNTKNKCTGGFESYKNFTRNICPLVYHTWLAAAPPPPRPPAPGAPYVGECN